MTVLLCIKFINAKINNIIFLFLSNNKHDNKNYKTIGY